jgi:poly(3-hydroxybutyrate) depolymerase
MKARILWLTLLILLAGCCPSTPVPAAPSVPVVQEPGQIVEVEDTYGTFYTYLPTTAPAQPEIVVLVHGTPPKGTTGPENARYYIVNWVDFAEAHGCLLLAPGFTQEDFSSVLGDHALGGYRGLFGRQIAADAWVLRLVDAYQQSYGLSGERFYLYGHSAGGQFTARFLVAHPERIARAVITSAATYPQPDTQVTWPFGMGELHTAIEWDAENTRRVDIVPDRQTWLAATQRPLTVIVGLADTSELPAYPGQKGTDRYTIGSHWVEDMAAFAAQDGLASRIEFEAIPGIGHTMTGLLPFSQAALMDR